jgi:hypothetical protein
MTSKFDRVTNKQRSGAAAEHEDCDGCVGLRAMRGIQQQPQSAASAATATTAQTATAMPAPPDIGEVGRGTWTLLHTMAAYYPEKADAGQQKATKAFLESLGAVVSQSVSVVFSHLAFCRSFRVDGAPTTLWCR